MARNTQTFITVRLQKKILWWATVYQTRVTDNPGVVDRVKGKALKAQRINENQVDDRRYRWQMSEETEIVGPITVSRGDQPWRKNGHQPHRARK